MDENTTSECPQTTDQKIRKNLLKLALIAFVSAFWLFIRTVRKPSRIYYPCQQAAIINIQTFRLTLLTAISTNERLGMLRKFAQPALVGIVLTSSLFIAMEPSMFLVDSLLLPVDEPLRIPLTLVPVEATNSESASDIFLVQNASGLEGNTNLAMTTLIQLMADQGIDFYQSDDNLDGLIGNDDVVLLKVNGQWGSRGGTNTDLVKSVIEAIVNHPEGFTGEIVMADNGQSLGNMNWSYANSYHRNQSYTDLVAFFPSHKISTKLWDDLRPFTVSDYDEDDLRQGYVRSTIWNSDTEIFVSYPKWQTPYGTYISFRRGIWDNETGFNSDRLKVINMPVMKSHFRYGVTGCIKHYMGLPQGHVLTSVDPYTPHEHFSIALGGMGTLMAETRFPILNILDTIWINANPAEGGYMCGPSTSYRAASFTDIISASQDPIALDYYASKNILVPTAEYENHTEYDSLDPDYEPRATHQMDESFHYYLLRSMNVLDEAGFQVTMNLEEMNVHVEVLPEITSPTVTPTNTTTSTSPSDIPTQPLSPLFILIPASASVIVIAAIILVKRKGSITPAEVA